MTNEKTTNTENQQAPYDAQNNKAVFGPLGKYAIIAVIMVSIIVTTAIMLDKQLNSVDQHIAKIEDEVAAMNNYTDVKSTNSDEIQQSTSDESAATALDAPATEAVSALVATPKQAATVAEITSTEDIAETKQATAAQTTVAQATTATLESTNVHADSTDELLESQDMDHLSVAHMNKHKQVKENQNRNYQARIDALKTEQKQHMAEVFSRIKSLESNQLTQYKETQDKQIAHLRNQVSQQKTMIDALILRNNDLFELRAANMQRNQTQREEILNRI